MPIYPSDPPQETDETKKCQWNSGSVKFNPTPVIKGQSFKVTYTVNCTQVCKDPHHAYWLEISGWVDGHGWKVGWDNDGNWIHTEETLGEHGVDAKYNSSWWDDFMNEENWNLSKGIKASVKVKCGPCNSEAIFASLSNVNFKERNENE
jgi:hypothetical protein